MLKNRFDWGRYLYLTPVRLVIFTALVIVTTANLTFWLKVNEIYSFGDNLLFFILLLLLATGVVVFLQAFAMLFAPARAVATFFLLLSAATAYFIDKFGVVFDADMVRNVLQTDRQEATDLWGVTLVIRLLLLAAIPIAIVWLVRFKTPGWLAKTTTGLTLMVCSVVVIAASIFADSSGFYSFFREHKPIRYYVNPAYPIYGVSNYVAGILSEPGNKTFTELARSPHIPASDHQRELVIVVVGETARADHFSLNGYARPTNPRLAGEAQLISFSNVSSCGTSTAVSVPCMFAFDGRESFDVDESRYFENALDVIARAGVDVLWRDNNSSSKGVADRVKYQDYKSPEVNPVCDEECRDIGMLQGLQEYIDSRPKDILIVLHQMGSHGPAYYKRYPPEFEKFTPVCQSIELASCTREEIINAYDNSILYTDYFLSQAISLLKANAPKFQTSLFYVSDHGESLGENGLYLHGMPYSIAPREQTWVPLIIWADSASDIDMKKTEALKNKAKSNDYISECLLDIFEIDTEINNISLPGRFYAKL